jgi:hypothetical protein
LTIFCKTSVTSASSSAGLAPVRASMSRFLIAACASRRVPVVSLSPPYIAAIVAALMLSRIIGPP